MILAPIKPCAPIYYGRRNYPSHNQGHTGISPLAPMLCVMGPHMADDLTHPGRFYRKKGS